MKDKSRTEEQQKASKIIVGIWVALSLFWFGAAIYSFLIGLTDLKGSAFFLAISLFLAFYANYRY